MKIKFSLLPTTIIFLAIFSTLGCKKEPAKDNTPIIVLTAEPNPVSFLGSTHLSWSCSNVTECSLNGQLVSLNSHLYILNLKSDTTFVISCKSEGSIISKSITVKVGDKTLYMKYIDTLCTGKWVRTQERTYGIPIWGTKPNEWYIRNSPIGDLSDGVDYGEN